MPDNTVGRMFQYAFLFVGFILLPIILPMLLMAVGIVGGLIIQYAIGKLYFALREEKKREATKGQKGD